MTQTRVFVVFLAVLGLLYMATFPPFTVPDEHTHFIMAYECSNYLLFCPSGEYIHVRADDLAAINEFSRRLTVDNWNTLTQITNAFCQDGTLVNSEWNPMSISADPPQTRIAAAIGIAIGRLLGLGAVPLFYLGRIFNFASFVALAGLAVHFTPTGRKIMIAIACLPMTLHVTASYSYDAGIIGGALLLTALLFRAIYADTPVSRKLMAGIAVTAFLLAPCKVVYSLIAFVVFLIPNSKFQSRREALLFKFGVMALVCVSVISLRLPSLIGIAHVDAAALEPIERDGEVGYYYSLSDILADPAGAVLIMLRTTVLNAAFFFKTTLGGSLGWFQGEIGAPAVLVFAFFAVLLASIPSAKGQTPAETPVQRIVYIAIFFGVYVLVLLSMFLGWTFNTSDVIQGVQGRYFLPALPLLLFAMKTKRIEYPKDPTYYILGAIAALNIINLIWIIAHIPIG